MRGGHVAVMVNDDISPYFKTHKGVRQGDSLSPLLFYLERNALAIIMDRNQRNLIFAAIDRVLSSTSWDAHFPLTTLHALPRVGSDHAPLLLDSGYNNNKLNRPFRFEKWWLSQPGFRELVAQIWATPSPFSIATDTWIFKTKLFRKKVKGWSINIDAAIKKKKRKDLLTEFDILDVFSEQNLVSKEDLNRMKEIQDELRDIWKKEEIAMWQRSRGRKILKGDQNTAYSCCCKSKKEKKPSCLVNV